MIDSNMLIINELFLFYHHSHKQDTPHFESITLNISFFTYHQRSRLPVISFFLVKTITDYVGNLI